jgi:hypothetical protein
MKSIINLFWGICLMRQSPAAVPAQGGFVAAVVVANLLASLVVSLSLAGNPGFLVTLTGIIVGQAVTASLLWILLGARNLRARFTTTLAALFGCDVVITACFGLALPLLSLLGASATTLAFLLFLVWSVAVAGFILHRALDVRLAIGIGLALGMSLLSVALSQIAVGA